MKKLVPYAWNWARQPWNLALLTGLATTAAYVYDHVSPTARSSEQPAVSTVSSLTVSLGVPGQGASAAAEKSSPTAVGPKSVPPIEQSRSIPASLRLAVGARTVLNSGGDWIEVESLEGGRDRFETEIAGSFWTGGLVRMRIGGTPLDLIIHDEAYELSVPSVSKDGVVVAKFVRKG